MPQVIGDRLVTASAIGQINSLDKKTGKVVWSKDLYKEFGGTRLPHGYSCHALPYKDSLILLAGGPDNAALALRQSDGAVLWKGMASRNAYSSPLFGYNGPAFMTCVNLRSGQVAWQERGFAKGQLVKTGEKLILLDEEGTLALIDATPAGLRVLAKESILQSTAWTPPTLSGSKLYLRDRKSLMALDLAAKASR
jgi:outer membrane protein assembly factor BamB